MAVVLLANLFFFWTNANIDSYFFWAFGRFLSTGIYPFLPDFTYARPTTMAPPMTSILMAISQLTPFAGLFLRSVQTMLLLGTAYLLYRLLRRNFSKKAATTITCIFLLIPGNLIYVNNLMSEILAQFFITLILYFILTKKYSLAFFWSCVGMLSKYAILIYAPIALLFPSKKRLPFILAGLLIVLSWISINWSITGRLGLSDLSGGHLWNNVLWVAGITPSEKSAPMKRLRTYIGTVDIKRPYWEMQTHILPKVKNDFTTLDILLGAVAVQAIREQPVRYAYSIVRGFMSLHANTLPCWKNLGTFGRPQGAYPVTCETLGTITLCQPIISTPWNILVWNGFIYFSTLFYRYVWPICMIIFFVALLRGKMLSLLYIVVILFHAALEHHDTRYLVPFYPQIILIIAYGLHEWYSTINAYRR